MCHTHQVPQLIPPKHNHRLPQPPTTPFRSITLPEIITALDTQALTSADLVQAFTLRAHQIDTTFSSIVQLSACALSHAHTLDTELTQHARRGPLHGIPLLLKDNIATLDDTDTCAGSLALVGARPSREADVVDLSSIRIAIPSGFSALANLSPIKASKFIQLLSSLEHAGVTRRRNNHPQRVPHRRKSLRVPPPLSTSNHTRHRHQLAINTYFSSLATNPHNIHNLRDLIAFTKTCPAEEYPRRNVQVLERAQATEPGIPLFKTMVAKEAYFIREGGIAGALCRHRCVVLLSPTLVSTLQIFAAMAGSPVLSVPMGVYPADTAVVEDSQNGLVEVAPGIP
ncbi:hypothetical protein J1614_004109 [Plenodomus biglobosus]|nr:hypothetical protein J1614_004109 [Plenodomus biglobosus]